MGESKILYWHLHGEIDFILLGILHIINAVIILGIGIALKSGLYHGVTANASATSIWTPLVFIITGILGLFIICYPKNRGVVMSHNTFSIISIVLAASVIVVSAVGVT